ncbi:MAG: hypothetical protein ABL886_03350 [Rhodoglobus sp.]
MFFDGPGFGGGIAHFASFIVTGLFCLFAFLVVAAMLFLLVRFLLIGTKAAQVYVAKNAPPAPAATVTTVTKPTAAKPAAKTTPRPGTPKAP